MPYLKQKPLSLGILIIVIILFTFESVGFAQENDHLVFLPSIQTPPLHFVESFESGWISNPWSLEGDCSPTAVTAETSRTGQFSFHIVNTIDMCQIYAGPIGLPSITGGKTYELGVWIKGKPPAAEPSPPIADLSLGIGYYKAVESDSGTTYYPISEESKKWTISTVEEIENFRYFSIQVQAPQEANTISIGIGVDPRYNYDIDEKPEYYLDDITLKEKTN